MLASTQIVINFSQNFIFSLKCQQCCLTSDKYIGIISKENEFTNITYFGYFGCVYPRSRKGHQISDHFDGKYSTRELDQLQL